MPIWDAIVIVRTELVITLRLGGEAVRAYDTTLKSMGIRSLLQRLKLLVALSLRNILFPFPISHCLSAHFHHLLSISHRLLAF